MNNVVRIFCNCAKTIQHHLSGCKNCYVCPKPKNKMYSFTYSRCYSTSPLATNTACKECYCSGVKQYIKQAIRKCLLLTFCLADTPSLIRKNSAQRNFSKLIKFKTPYLFLFSLQRWYLPTFLIYCQKLINVSSIAYSHVIICHVFVQPRYWSILFIVSPGLSIFSVLKFVS